MRESETVSVNIYCRSKQDVFLFVAGHQNVLGWTLITGELLEE